MKYFDVHQHYTMLSFAGVDSSESEANWSLGEDGLVFEDYLIRKCKELDMVVAVNGLGIDMKNKIAYNANDRVEKFFKQYPEHIIGMAYINLDEDKPGIITEYFKKGFKGCKFIWTKKKYDDPSYMEYYKRCEYHNMVALFHTGILGGIDLAWPSPGSCSDNMNPITMEQVGFQNQNLKVIGAHLGTGYYMVACWVALASVRGAGNVYFDISGGDFMDPIYENRYIGKDIPVSQVLFGCDEPIERYKPIIEKWESHFDEIKLSQEDKDNIFYRNACKIFNMKCD